MRINFAFIIILCVSSICSIAQKNVGIGTKEPHNSAVLEISSNSQGVLVPRLNEKQRVEIAQPAKGLLVFQMDQKSGFYFFDGNKWEPLISETQAKSVAADPNDWTITGNSGLGASNFIGTTDGADLVFKVNNSTVGRFVNNGSNYNLLFGGDGSNLGTNNTGNIAIGSESLKSTPSTVGSYNVAVGHQSQKNNLGTGNNTSVIQPNTSIGSFSLLTNTTGFENEAFGYNSLKSNTTGYRNEAIGTFALYENTTGFYNIGLGYNALNPNKSGYRNIGIGPTTLRANVSGYNNIAIGSNAQYFNMNGWDNVAIGIDALKSSGTISGSLVTGTTGIRNNVIIGNYAGLMAKSSYNTYIGYSAGYSNVDGEKNVFIGYQAGYSELGSNKLYIANSSSVNPLVKGDFLNKNLLINVGPSNTATQGYFAIGDFDASSPMTIAPGYRLIVQDGIITEKIKIALKESSFWADYVFDENYKLRPLHEVEHFVKENKHLPNVPSAAEVLENGIDIATMNARLLEKVEELTLYIIEQEKRILKLEEDRGK